MPRRGGGAGAIGIVVLLAAGALALAAFTRKEPEIPEGERPTPPPGDGRPEGPLAFEPVLLGEPKVMLFPF